MKTVISDINKLLESRIRLGAMSALAVSRWLDFNSLKEFLNVTDGNLSSHLKALEKERYVIVEKSFIGRKPNTKYSMTPRGRKAFTDHLKGF